MQLTSLVETSDVSCMWFTDEKLFTVATPKNSQNDRLYVPAATKKKDRRDMIETYKILSGKYDTNVVPTLKTTGIKQPGVMIWEFSKLVLNMTCASFILLIA